MAGNSGKERNLVVASGSHSHSTDELGRSGNLHPKKRARDVMAQENEHNDDEESPAKVIKKKVY